MAEYSVLTFVIGKGYETVHEIDAPQEGVEYLLVTDDPDLRSRTWKVVYDENLLKYASPFERCFRVRYGVFGYCSTDVCVTIDGSMRVKGPLDGLVREFVDGGYDICLMPHPLRSDFVSEYRAWISARGYPPAQAERALNWFRSKGYDFGYRGLFQLCFSIKRRSETTAEIDRATMECLEDISCGGVFERLDQTVFTYVMNTRFSSVKVLPVSEQVVRSKAIQWYWHNSDRPNMNAFYDVSRSDVKWMFDRQVECRYLF